MLRPRQGERGAIAVLGVLILLAVGAFMALAINMGFVVNARAQLQHAADSAALAAGASLDGARTGIDHARLMALAYSNAHKVTGETVVIDPARDVIFGAWHYGAGCVYGSTGGDCFEPIDPDATDPVLGGPNYFRIDSVKVVNGRDGGGHNSPLSTMLGFFLGDPASTSVQASAVALGRHARVDCSAPLALASCKILDAGSLACNGSGTARRLTLANGKVGELGFINLIDSRNVNASFLRDVILNLQTYCANQDFHTGNAPVANGNDLQPLIDAFLGEDQNAVVGPCLIGHTLTAAVTNNSGCSAGSPNFTGDQPVIGYVSITIVGITCANGAFATCPAPGGPATKCSTKTNNGNGSGTSADTNKGNGNGGSKLGITVDVLCDAPKDRAGQTAVLQLVH